MTTRRYDEEGAPRVGAPAACSRAAIDACPGGEEGHLAHLDLNGECPWCGASTDELASQQDTPEYRAYLAMLAHEDENSEHTCAASFITGPRDDPYGTECDQLAGHYPTTKHEGDDPFDNGGRVRWTGGGLAGGDPLPYRDVEWTEPK